MSAFDPRAALSRVAPCQTCSASGRVPNGPHLTHQRYLAAIALADHRATSPAPQDRDAAEQIRQDAEENIRPGFQCDDAGALVWRETDGGPLVPCPETVWCPDCDGTGSKKVPLQPLEIRAVLEAQQRQIDALRLKVDALAKLVNNDPTR